MNQKDYAEFKGIKRESYPMDTNEFVAKVAKSPGFIFFTITGIVLLVMVVIQGAIGFSINNILDIFKTPISIINYVLLTPPLLPFIVLVIGQIIFMINGLTRKKQMSMAGLITMGIAFKIQMVLQIILTVITTLIMMYVMSAIHLKAGIAWLVILTYLAVMICYSVMFSSLNRRMVIYRYMLETNMVVSDAFPTYPAIMCFIMAILVLAGCIISVILKDWLMFSVMLVEIFYYIIGGILMIANKIYFIGIKRNIMNS